MFGVEVDERAGEKEGPPESLLKSFCKRHRHQKRIDGDSAALNSDNVRSRFVTSTELNEAVKR